MPFKTLDEAHDYELAMEKKYKDLETAKSGLETKLQETQNANVDFTAEINRLKIKNYEYYEQITVGKQTTNTITTGEPEEKEIKLDEIIKDI